MNKLVIVGMRFEEQEFVKEVITSFKEGKNPQLFLKREKNVNDPNWISVAVYYLPHWGIKESDRVRVGYVREKDKQECLDNFSTRAFDLTSVNTNWWCITKSTSADPYRSDEVRKACSQEYETKYLDSSASSVPINTPKVKLTQEAYTPISKFNQSNKEDTKMNANNMRESFFREVKNVVIDIQSGKFGVLSNDGISVYTEGGISVNPIAELGVKIPAFALRVAVKDLKEGDIVINGNESTFFRGLAENGYEVVNLSGEVKQVGSVTNMFFGKNSVLAVKNMFGEGTNPMMMALLMGDEGFGKGDNKKLMLAMAMSGGFGGGDIGGMNPLMWMLMLDK